jgi:hypothetical protein
MIFDEIFPPKIYAQRIRDYASSLDTNKMNLLGELIGWKESPLPYEVFDRKLKEFVLSLTTEELNRLIEMEIFHKVTMKRVNEILCTKS